MNLICACVYYATFKCLNFIVRNPASKPQKENTISSCKDKGD